MSEKKSRVRKCDHGNEWDMCDICKPAPSELAPAPGYTDICKMIMEAPQTWAGGFVSAALVAAKRKRFFKDDAALLAFAKRVVEEHKSV